MDKNTDEDEEGTFTKITGNFLIFCTILQISYLILDTYILPEMAIHIYKKNKKTEIACAHYYLGTGKKGNYFKINGKSYFAIDVTINNWLNRQKNDFPIELKKKQFIRDRDVAREQHKCLFEEYITVIDLPFWKQIYLYDYSFNPADLKNNHNK